MKYPIIKELLKNSEHRSGIYITININNLLNILKKYAYKKYNKQSR